MDSRAIQCFVTKNSYIYKYLVSHLQRLSVIHFIVVALMTDFPFTLLALAAAPFIAELRNVGGDGSLSYATAMS